MVAWRVKILKKDAVHLYWLLEGYENLWFFTTSPGLEGEKERFVTISSPESLAEEAEISLRKILEEVPHLSFEKTQKSWLITFSNHGEPLIF